MSATLPLRRRHTLVARFATRPPNPSTASCGRNTCSSKNAPFPNHCFANFNDKQVLTTVLFVSLGNSQLFGEADPDEDVSPDTEDPEAAGDAGQSAAESEAKSNGTGKSNKAQLQLYVTVYRHVLRIYTYLCYLFRWC